MLGLLLRILPFILILLIFLFRSIKRKRDHNARLNAVRERNAARFREDLRRNEWDAERERRLNAVRERREIWDEEQRREEMWRNINQQIQGSMKRENIVPNRPDLGQREYIFRNDVWELRKTSRPTNEFIKENEMEID